LGGCQNCYRHQFCRREKPEGEVVKEKKLVAPTSEDNIKEESCTANTAIENTLLEKLSMNKYKKD
jgi:hypothetical protein